MKKFTSPYDKVRKQIQDRYKYRYPRGGKFTLSDTAIQRFLKEHKGNIDDIVTEVRKIIIRREKELREKGK